MDEQAILNALALGEERDWEFKSAKEGSPVNGWFLVPRETPYISGGTSYTRRGTPYIIPGSPRAVPGTPRAHAGRLHAHAGGLRGHGDPFHPRQAKLCGGHPEAAGRRNRAGRPS